MIHFCPNLTPEWISDLIWDKLTGAPFLYIRPDPQRVRARLCCLLTWTGVPLPNIWQFSGTPHQSFWSLPPSCLCVIAAALCEACCVSVRVCNIGCIPIHYSAPVVRRSMRAAAPAVTGQPGIHESVIILSSLFVSLPFPPLFSVLALYLCLHLSVSPALSVIHTACQPVHLSPLCLLSSFFLLGLSFFYRHLLLLSFFHRNISHEYGHLDPVYECRT